MNNDLTINCGLVLQGSLSDLEQIFEFINQTQTKVVFVKKSLSKIYIAEEEVAKK